MNVTKEKAALPFRIHVSRPALALAVLTLAVATACTRGPVVRTIKEGKTVFERK